MGEARLRRCRNLLHAVSFRRHVLFRRYMARNGETIITPCLLLLSISTKDNQMLPNKNSNQSCDDPDTIPMIKVAEVVELDESEYMTLYFCSKCGCNYSSGECPKEGHNVSNG